MAPAQPWPNERATAVAARAGDVTAGARVFASLAASLEDRDYVLATSGRPRGVGAYLPTLPASRLAAELPAGQRARLPGPLEGEGAAPLPSPLPPLPATTASPPPPPA